MANGVLDLLSTSSFRETVVRGSGRHDNGTVARGLAELGSAQSRLQTLDDDYYVRGVLAPHRYRSLRVRLEREVERLHALVDGAGRQRILLHLHPRRWWSEADFGQRRELVRLIVERVEVMAARRGTRFDPSRITVSIPLASPSPLSGPDGVPADGVGGRPTHLVG